MENRLSSGRHSACRAAIASGGVQEAAVPMGKRELSGGEEAPPGCAATQRSLARRQGDGGASLDGLHGAAAHAGTASAYAASRRAGTNRLQDPAIHFRGGLWAATDVPGGRGPAVANPGRTHPNAAPDDNNRLWNLTEHLGGRN